MAATHVVLGALVAWVLYCLYSAFKFRKLRAIPGPTTYPGLGNLFQLSSMLRGQQTYSHLPEKEFRAGIEHVTKTHPLIPWLEKWRTFVVWLGPTTPMVVCTEPSSIQDVMGKRGPRSKATAVYRFLYPWLGTGLLTSSGAKWHTRRLMITPSFHFDMLRSYYTTFARVAQEFVQHVDAMGGKRFHVFPLYNRATLDVMTECATGRAVGALSAPDVPYLRAVAEQTSLVFLRALVPVLWPDWLWRLSPCGRRANASLKVLHDYTKAMISTRRQQLRAVGMLPVPGAANPLAGAAGEDVPATGAAQHAGVNPHRKTFLDVLLTATDEAGQPMDDEGIREEVDTFVFEAHDTTSTGLTWTTYFLGCYPDVQRRLQAELDAVLGDRAVPTLDDLNNLPFLAACVKEGLRMVPPVPLIARECDAPTKVGGYDLPPGTLVTLPIMFLHHNETVWEDSWMFKPDRFMGAQDHNAPKRSPFAFTAFSAGARNCIGRNFALTMKVMLATLFKSFDVAVPVDQTIKFHIRIINKPRDGKLEIRCTRRQASRHPSAAAAAVDAAEAAAAAGQ